MASAYTPPAGLVLMTSDTHARLPGNAKAGPRVLPPGLEIVCPMTITSTPLSRHCESATIVSHRREHGCERSAGDHCHRVFRRRQERPARTSVVANRETAQSTAIGEGTSTPRPADLPRPDSAPFVSERS